MERIVPLSPVTRHGPRELDELVAETQLGNTVSLPISDAILHAARDAFLVLTERGEILSTNPAALRLFDCAEDALVGAHVFDVVRLHNSGLQKGEVLKVPDSLMLGEVETNSGRFVPVEITMLRLHGGDRRLIAIQLRDISTHSELETQLHRLAYFDATTQLPNRYATLLHLGELIESDADFAVLHFNIDRFRVLKNSLGHRFADRVLNTISERVKGFLDGAWLSRLGNDEFIIILPMFSTENLRQVTEKLQLALSRNLVIDGRDIHLTASIGVVVSNPAYSDPAEILSDAEIAAFQAKLAGGGTFAVFDQPMREVLMDLQTIEADLREAVKGGAAIWVAYQPIVDLKSGVLAGFEALARWNHPVRGAISPTEFIPIAEATGLIVPLGMEMLTKACRDAQRWMKALGSKEMPFISVNLSLRQLSEDDFIDRTRHLLAETGIRPSKLKLEITESTLMANPEEAIKRLQEIRALGIELSIDDFGTGYSSLAYLHRLPVKNLKIDRSFVVRIGEHNDREIVRIITELAGILSLTVIAEGVETIGDVETLQAVGCTYGQGFFFSRPVNLREAELLIKNPSPPWLSSGSFAG